MSAGNYGTELLEGLDRISIELSKVGNVYRGTTQEIGAKLQKKIVEQGFQIKDENKNLRTIRIPELDQIIIVPRLAKNDVGASELYVTACFYTQNGGNVFYRGKGGAATSSNGRINAASLSGSGTGNNSSYGTSDEFRRIIAPLCPMNDRGKPILNFKPLSGTHNIVTLELDFVSVMMLALGIKSDDQYDYTIMSVNPIPNTDDNFMVYLAKIIGSTGYRSGHNSNVNYARVSQQIFHRVNNNGGGGRQY